MYQYPHSIDNGHGEKLTFIGRRSRNGEEYLEVENFVLPGSGPPMHVHHQQDESLTVVSGKLGFEVLGEEPAYLAEGGSATFRRGVMHRFWNAGDTPLICTGHVTPAHNMEYFLTEVYRSMRAAGNGRPSNYDIAFLLNRYKTEFDMHGIPTFVRKVIFPLVLRIGNLRGMKKKFQNAPEPLAAAAKP